MGAIPDLTALLEKPGEIVSRDELRARLWPEGTFVDFDKSLRSDYLPAVVELDESAGACPAAAPEASATAADLLRPLYGSLKGVLGLVP